MLFGTGFAAGFVDSVAGGGGLITIPVLLSLGLDPRDALGTNKLQASFGSGSATWHYARAGVVDVSENWRGFAITFVFAALGTWMVQQLSRDFLERFIPVLLVIVAAYMLLRPELGKVRREAKLRQVPFDWWLGAFLGFYDGFFGPGTGTFWAMAYVLLRGHGFTEATGRTKVMNFASNLSSLLVFSIAGHVLILPGIVMGAGQWLGARVGSRTVVKHGARFIRPIFIAVVLAITSKLIYEAYWK
jgi:Predicted permeases